MDLKETAILSGDIGGHWYYSSKAKAMSRVLKKHPHKILDVGAGSAFFSQYLLTHTAASEAWCVDISYDADANERFAGKPVYFRRGVGTSAADLVLLMDVLEHVDDDRALLQEYVNKVEAGTQFLLTVPAFRMLWSPHDEFLEHRRRYTLRQLETVARSAGLEVDHGSYFFGMVFPIAAALRLVQRMLPTQEPKSQLKSHHPLVNSILKTMCSIELPWMRVNRLAGLTVVCLATKRH
jgi:SAM-dependent methyltransferase